MIDDITEKAGPSSAAQVSKEELDSINEILSIGKRHLVCNEPDQALDYFVQLCERLSSIYGETADECSEAYLYYGKTLLELARLENGVLGHAVKEAPVFGTKDDTETDTKTDDDEDDVTPEKRDKIRENVENALRGGNLYNDATTEEECETTEGEGEDEQSKEKDESELNTDKPEVKDSETSADKSSDKTSAYKLSEDEKMEANMSTERRGDGDEVINENGDYEGEGTEDDNEEAITNMKLSWEMFEVTCSICQRMIEEGKDLKKSKGMLAEAKYGLAQISMESEHYDLAIADFTECLEIYKEILEDQVDRRIAEVLYNIGLAYSFNKQFDKAIEQFKAAVDCLQSRLKTLQEKINNAVEKGGKDKDKASSELDEWTKEVSELKDIIELDMVTKIEDAEEMKKQSDVEIQRMKEATKEIFSSLGTSSGFDTGFDGGFDGGFDSSANSNEVVNDISHKIRSTKRKSDIDDLPVEPKKVKQVNGGGENGDVNGAPPLEEKTPSTTAA